MNIKNFMLAREIRLCLAKSATAQYKMHVAGTMMHMNRPKTFTKLHHLRDGRIRVLSQLSGKPRWFTLLGGDVIVLYVGTEQERQWGVN